MSSEIKSVVTLISFGTAAWVIAGLVLAITGADARSSGPVLQEQS